MTSPKLARATEQGRYYEDPNPAFDGAMYPSVTNVIDTAVSKHVVLLPWTAKLTAEYALAHLRDLQVQVADDPKGALKLLKAQAPLVRDAAADLGDRIHSAAERHNLGLPREFDADVAPFFRQYLAFLATWGVDLAEDLEAAEVSVVHRGIGYAGTLDILLWLRSGPDGSRELWLIDLKSSSTQRATSVYREHVLQVAALRFAKTLWLPGGLEADMPAVDRCAVLNLRSDDHALIELPADKSAFAAFQGALAVTKFLHGLDLKAATRVVRAPSRAAVKEAA